MLNIGCHLSVSKGFENMGKEALSINANTFQFFTRNPRGGKAKDLDDKDIQAFLEIAKENKFGVNENSRQIILILLLENQECYNRTNLY